MYVVFMQMFSMMLYLCRCWDKDPKKRLTSAELLDKLTRASQVLRSEKFSFPLLLLTLFSTPSILNMTCLLLTLVNHRHVRIICCLVCMPHFSVTSLLLSSFYIHVFLARKRTRTSVSGTTQPPPKGISRFVSNQETKRTTHAPTPIIVDE